MIQLQHIDHVAIRATDPERSARWYMDVLGLKRCPIPEWDPYPIMMMSGDQGIAIFPPKGDPDDHDPRSVRIDHIAFRVDGENFARAQVHFDQLQIPYTIQDHVYFHSLYLHDPDGHQIELTTPVKPLPTI